jgi:hypothetical protein
MNKNSSVLCIIWLPFFAIYFLAIILCIMDMVYFFKSIQEPEFYAIFMQKFIDAGPVIYWLAIASLYIFGIWLALFVIYFGSQVGQKAGPLALIGIIIAGIIFILSSFNQYRWVVLIFVGFFTIYFGSLGMGLDGHEEGKHKGFKSWIAPIIPFAYIIYDLYTGSSDNSEATSSTNPIDQTIGQYIPVPNLGYLILSGYLLYTIIKSGADLRQKYRKLAFLNNPVFYLLFGIFLIVISPNLPLRFYDIALAIFFLIGWITGKIPSNR